MEIKATQYSRVFQSRQGTDALGGVVSEQLRKQVHCDVARVGQDQAEGRVGCERRLRGRRIAALRVPVVARGVAVRVRGRRGAVAVVGGVLFVTVGDGVLQ
jgi:hypothetical protein